MGQGQVTVDLASAHMKNTHHGKTLKPWKHASWGNGHFWRNKGDFVTQANTKFGGGLVAQHHAKIARLQRV